MTNRQRVAIRDDSTVDASTFAVLADERRRTLLRCLRTSNGPVGVADLARDVVASERDVDARDVPEEGIERVYVSLHHRHLPKLADAGYLRYHHERKSVVLTDDAESLDSALEWATRLTE